VLAKIISGGQAGADLGALHAARAAGIPTGGYAAKGFLTEYGPAPELADFGLVEHSSPGYPARTWANVTAADAALWFGDPHSPGGRATLPNCRARNLPYLVVRDWAAPQVVADWLREHVFPGREGGVTLLVAGNRESSAPGIGDRVEAFLGRVLRLLQGGEGRP
jgi:hypothetical protein